MFSPTIWLTTSCKASGVRAASAGLHRAAGIAQPAGLPARRRWCRLISSSSTRPSAVSVRERGASTVIASSAFLSSPATSSRQASRIFREGIAFQGGISIQAECLAPCRIGVEELARHVERCNHFARVLKHRDSAPAECAYPRPRRVDGLVQRDRHQPGRQTIAITQRGDVQRTGKSDPSLRRRCVSKLGTWLGQAK